MTYEGLNIRGCQDVDQGYLYAISDAIVMPYTLKDEAGDDSESQYLTNWKYSESGFYVYDIAQLFNGKIEKYKLSPAVGGVSNEISVSKFSNRIAFIQNFDNIAVIPFPHLNLINCEGMAQKHEYLIWREKNGFFTALDRRSNLLTWSLTTGKLLYSET